MAQNDRKRAGIRPRRGRRGATQVLVAIAIPVLLGMAAVAVDVGRVAVEKQRLRQICDVAALEGAKDLPTTSVGGTALAAAEETARRYGLANGADRGGVTLTMEATQAAGSTGARLEVTASESVPMTFARIWGKESCQLQVEAVAEREPAPGWVPFAIEKNQTRWKSAIESHLEQQVTLDSCAAGQWWVTAADGIEVANFEQAFQGGENTPLNGGESIELSRSRNDYPLKTVLEAVQERSGQTVQVLVVDDVMKPGTTQPVQGPDDRGTTRFNEFATVQITGVDLKQGVYKIRVLSEGTGSLSAGATTGAGQVRIIE